MVRKIIVAYVRYGSGFCKEEDNIAESLSYVWTRRCAARAVSEAVIMVHSVFGAKSNMARTISNDTPVIFDRF